MALRKFSIKTSVFLISDEYTSLPTMGQNGTFKPSSCDRANATAVFPVPGAPANKIARPAIFFDLTKSTITPAASRADSCPTKPAPVCSEVPSVFRPNPFI